MKKSLQLSMLLSFILLFNITAHAQEQKTITLKDGSALQGKVLSMQNNEYTIETSNLGQVTINESNILEIKSKNNLPKNNESQGSSNNSGEMKQMAQQMQMMLMSDPALMMEIQNLTQDPEVVALLSDPNFMRAVMNYDTNGIMNNQNTDALLNNPKIQRLINIMGQKMGNLQQ